MKPFDWNIGDFQHAQANKEPISILRADRRYTTGSAKQKVVESIDALVTYVGERLPTINQSDTGVTSNMSLYEVKPLIPNQNVKRRDTIRREKTGETLTVVNERTVGRRQTIYCESLEKET